MSKNTKSKNNKSAKYLKNITLYSLAFLALVMIPGKTFADSIKTSLGEVQVYSEFISEVWKWGAQIVFAAAVIAIIVGGIAIVSSGGSEDRADTGRKTVRGGIIGISITLLSAVFDSFIKTPVDQTDQHGVGGIVSSLHSAATSLMAVVGAVSAVGIVYAGIKYMTSGGDEEKLGSAKLALKLSIIGAAIAFSAWGILGFLKGSA